MQQLAINLLTLVLVVIALFLGLLILVQLPKKDAGITAAFGAESTAALFGAGSGTALSNITKWCAGLFLGLCFLIAIITASESQSRGVLKVRESLKTAATAPAKVNSILTPATKLTATNPLAAAPTNVAGPLKIRPATNAPGPKQ